MLSFMRCGLYIAYPTLMRLSVSTELCVVVIKYTPNHTHGKETHAWRVHLTTELKVKYRRTHFSRQAQIFYSWQFHQALNMRNELDG